VYGAFRGSPRGAKIFGPGILDGSRFDEHHMIRLSNACDVRFDGITIRCGRKNWINRLDRCERFVYRNVKVLSFTNQGDGIDPCNCRDFLIDDCFLRCADDCIAVKAYTNNGYPDCPYSPAAARNVSGITVTGCIMAGYGFSDGFTIGIECDTERIEDIVVKDCDILLARGNNAFGGHAAFSANCDGPAEIRNIRFENIRVGKNVDKNFQLAINDAGYVNQLRRTIGGDALRNLPAAAGHIKGVSLKNIQWEGAAPVILWSYDDRHRVEDVSFAGCTVEGKPLTIDQIKRFGAGPATRNVTVSEEAEDSHFPGR
jgi:polygalacturonase